MRSSYPNVEKQRKKLGKFLGNVNEVECNAREAAAMTLDLLASFDEKEHVLGVWKQTFRTEVLLPLREEKGHTYDFPDYKQALERDAE